MNSKLEDILVATLEKATVVGGEVYDATKDGFAKAVEFTQEQIPDIISQIMMWEFAHHLIIGVMYFIIFALLFGFGLKWWKRANKGSNWGEIPFTQPIIWNATMMVVACMFLFLGTLPNAMHCVKIKVAPKVFFIEYCSDLVQAHRAVVVKKSDGSAGMSYYRKHSH